MELKPLKSLQNLPDPFYKIFGFILQWTNQIQALFLTGNSFDVVINTTDTEINHGLGIVPNGWMILDKQANSNIWRVSWDDKKIVLRASSQVTIKLWIF